jgi:hypothetical protein
MYFAKGIILSNYIRLLGSIRILRDASLTAKNTLFHKRHVSMCVYRNLSAFNVLEKNQLYNISMINCNATAVPSSLLSLCVTFSLSRVKG